MEGRGRNESGVADCQPTGDRGRSVRSSGSFSELAWAKWNQCLKRGMGASEIPQRIKVIAVKPDCRQSSIPGNHMVGETRVLQVVHKTSTSACPHS